MGFWVLAAALVAGLAGPDVLQAAAPKSRLLDKYIIDSWQTEDGLPQNSITSITQTPDSYLWLGTFNGLVRFDGVRFKTFDPAVTPEMKSGRITKLLSTPSDLWVVSESGDVVRMAGGRFNGFSTQNGLPAAGAEFLSSDASGRIWMRDRVGNVHQYGGGRFSPAALPDGVAPGNFDWFLHDRSGAWVLQHDRSIAKLTGSRYVTLTEPGSDETSYVRHALPARDGAMWLTNGRVLRKYDEHGWRESTWNYSPHERTSVFDMCEDREGNVWLATFGHGLFCCQTNGSIRRITVADGLSHDTLRSVFEDSEGNIWVGTDGGGLNRLKPRLFSVHDVNGGLGGNIVMSISEDAQGVVWLASNGGGLNRVTNNQVSVVVDHPEAATNRYIWSVLADRQGDVWFGTWGNGLYRVHGGEYTKFTSEKGLAGNWPFVLFEDHAGILWVGGPDGLSRRSGENFVRQKNISNEVLAFAEDHEGRLFVGTTAGLECAQNGVFTHYDRRNGLPSHVIRGLYVDAENTLWLGTAAGLSRFKNGKFSNYSLADGLMTKAVGAILEDDGMNLWLMADQGVVRANRRNLEEFSAGTVSGLSCLAFAKAEGLGSGESSSSGRTQPAAWKSRDGRLWFSSVNGVSVVDPRRIKINTTPPPVFVEEVAIDERVFDRPGSAVFTVPAGSQRLEFRFTALDLSTANRAQFKYRLEGFDDRWIDAGTRRVAYYTHVAPGDYHFRVLACNGDGIWNNQGATLAVVVLPRYDQTWWFRTLLAGAGSAMVFWLVQRRVARLENQRRAQQKFSRDLIESQEQERKRIAAELHDSLGQNLLVIKNRALLGLNPGAVAEHTLDQLREISSTASQAIREVREIAQNLRPHLLDDLGLTQAIRSSANKMMLPTGIEFSIELSNIDKLVPPEFEINLFRIVQETLNNLVKHSGATKAGLIIEKTDKKVLLRITDNGHGFEVENARKAKTGFGLRSLAERARLMGGTCVITSSPVHGSAVTVEVPLDLAKPE